MPRSGFDRSWLRRTPYEVLGAKPQADSDEIRAAYRRLARRYHPDRAAEPTAARKMAEINAAWTVLRDREGRERLDAWLTRMARLPKAPKAQQTPIRVRCGTCDALDPTIREVGYPDPKDGSFEPDVVCARCRSAMGAICAWRATVASVSDPKQWEGAFDVLTRVAFDAPIAISERNARLLHAVGTVLAKHGDRDGARQAMTASLDYDWNADVAIELDELGGPIDWIPSAPQRAVLVGTRLIGLAPVAAVAAVSSSIGLFAWFSYVLG